MSSDGTQSGGTSLAISADGRHVSFESVASNLVAGGTNDVSDVFVHDRQGPSAAPVVSVGEVAVHEGDTGTRTAVFTVTLSEPATVTAAYATAEDSALGASGHMYVLVLRSGKGRLGRPGVGSFSSQDYVRAASASAIFRRVRKSSS